MSNYWRSGSMVCLPSRGNFLDLSWEKLSNIGILAAGFAGHYVGQQASIMMPGNSAAYKNHWMAYGAVKSQNRW